MHSQVIIRPFLKDSSRFFLEQVKNPPIKKHKKDVSLLSSPYCYYLLICIFNNTFCNFLKADVEKIKPPKDEFQSYVMKFSQAAASSGVFKSNRLMVWEEVNSAMKELIACASKMAKSGALDESLKYLLPKTGDALKVSGNESVFEPHTPALIYNETINITENTTDV